MAQINLEHLLDMCGEKYEPEYLFRQTAEEMCEFAQAALKVIRAFNHETPMSELEAVDKYIEEMADAKIMLDLSIADLTFDGKKRFDRIYSEKLERFWNRLEGSHETP